MTGTAHHNEAVENTADEGTCRHTIRVAQTFIRVAQTFTGRKLGPPSKASTINPCTPAELQSSPVAAAKPAAVAGSPGLVCHCDLLAPLLIGWLHI